MPPRRFVPPGRVRRRSLNCSLSPQPKAACSQANNRCSFECTYTSQKTKKNKSWKDGVCTCEVMQGFLRVHLFAAQEDDADPSGYLQKKGEPLDSFQLPPKPFADLADEEFEMPLYLVRFTRVIEEDQSPSKSACPHVKATVSVPEEGTREAAPFRAVSQGSAPGLLRTCSVPAPVCSETAPGAPSSSCVVPQNSPLLPRGYRGRGGLFSRRAAAAAAALERPSSDTDLPSSISASAAVGDWSTTPVPRGNERLSGGRLRQDELGASACGVQKATLVSSDSTRSTYSSGASAVEENLSEPENLDNGVSKFPFSCSTALSASSESSGSSSEKRERPSVSPADSGSAARGPAPSSVCPDGDDDREERLNSLFSRCPPFPSSRPSRVADASASPHHAVQDSAADRDLGTAGEALGVIVADSEETGSRGNTCPSSSPQEREALNFETSLDTGSGEDQSGNTKEPQVLSEREELERGVLEALAADCLVEEAVIPLSSCLPACLFPGTSPWVGGLANRRFSFSWGEELKADILSLNAMHREKRQQRMLATWRSSCIRSDTREGLPFQSDGTKAKESDDEDDPSCSRFLSRRSIVHGIEDSFDESLLFLSLFKSDASGNALDLSDDTPDALMKESDFGKEEESAEGPACPSLLPAASNQPSSGNVSSTRVGASSSLQAASSAVSATKHFEDPRLEPCFERPAASVLQWFYGDSPPAADFSRTSSRSSHLIPEGFSLRDTSFSSRVSTADGQSTSGRSLHQEKKSPVSSSAFEHATVRQPPPPPPLPRAASSPGQPAHQSEGISAEPRGKGLLERPPSSPETVAGSAAGGAAPSLVPRSPGASGVLQKETKEALPGEALREALSSHRGYPPPRNTRTETGCMPQGSGLASASHVSAGAGDPESRQVHGSSSSPTPPSFAAIEPTSLVSSCSPLSASLGSAALANPSRGAKELVVPVRRGGGPPRHHRPSSAVSLSSSCPSSSSDGNADKQPAPSGGLFISAAAQPMSVFALRPRGRPAISCSSSDSPVGGSRASVVTPDTPDHTLAASKRESQQHEGLPCFAPLLQLPPMSLSRGATAHQLAPLLPVRFAVPQDPQKTTAAVVRQCMRGLQTPPRQLSKQGHDDCSGLKKHPSFAYGSSLAKQSVTDALTEVDAYCLRLFNAVSQQVQSTLLEIAADLQPLLYIRTDVPIALQHLDTRSASAGTSSSDAGGSRREKPSFPRVPGTGGGGAGNVSVLAVEDLILQLSSSSGLLEREASRAAEMKLKRRRRMLHRQKRRAQRRRALKISQNKRERGTGGRDDLKDGEEEPGEEEGDETEEEEDEEEEEEDEETGEKQRLFLGFTNCRVRFLGGGDFRGRSRAADPVKVVKNHVSKNDIWALTVGEDWSDSSNVLLCRSCWKGLHPRSSSMEVEIFSPPPLYTFSRETFSSLSGTLRGCVPPASSALPTWWISGRGGAAQSHRRSGKRVVSGILLGNFSNEFAAIDGVERLWKASKLFGGRSCLASSMPLLHSSPSPSCKNFDATSFTLASDFPGVLDVSLCCLTEGLGLGDQGRTPQRKQDLRNTSPVSKSPRKEEERACRLQRERRGLLAPLSLRVTSRVAEKILLEAAAANKSRGPLNDEQKAVLLAVSCWFRYADSRVPFERKKPHAKWGRRQPEKRLKDKKKKCLPADADQYGDKDSRPCMRNKEASKNVGAGREKEKRDRGNPRVEERQPRESAGRRVDTEDLGDVCSGGFEGEDKQPPKKKKLNRNEDMLNVRTSLQGEQDRRGGVSEEDEHEKEREHTTEKLDAAERERQDGREGEGGGLRSLQGGEGRGQEGCKQDGGGMGLGEPNNEDEEEEEDWDSLMFAHTPTAGRSTASGSAMADALASKGDRSVWSPLAPHSSSLSSSPAEDPSDQSPSPWMSRAGLGHPSACLGVGEEASGRRTEKLFSSPEEGTGTPSGLEPKQTRRESRKTTFRRAQTLLKCSRKRKEAPPFLLVHGVFGAGKSSMLAATLVSLCRLLDEAESKSHVLLVCNTNTALDAVLLKLRFECQYTDFARVGRLSETHPDLLPHAIASTRDRSMAVEDWKRVLIPLLSKPHGAPSPEKPPQFHVPRSFNKAAGTPAARGCNSGEDTAPTDQKIPEEEEEGRAEPLEQMAARLLREIDRGTFPPTMVQWKSHRLLATTCSTAASSDVFSPPGPSSHASFPAFSACPAPFVFVDESTQVTESLALAVLTRFAAIRCLQVGDSKQLPPVVKNACQWGSRSLFRRLLPFHLNRMDVGEHPKEQPVTEESESSSSSTGTCSSSSAGLVAQSDEGRLTPKTGEGVPFSGVVVSDCHEKNQAREERSVEVNGHTAAEKAVEKGNTSGQTERLKTDPQTPSETHRSPESLPGVRTATWGSSHSAKVEAAMASFNRYLPFRASRHFRSLILLRTQYRCHPAISALCSRLFYGQDYLKDGVTADERSPPVPGWGGPLSCVIPRASSESRHGRSFINREEANVIAQLLFDAFRERGFAENISGTSSPKIRGVPPVGALQEATVYPNRAALSFDAHRKVLDRPHPVVRSRTTERGFLRPQPSLQCGRSLHPSADLSNPSLREGAKSQMQNGALPAVLRASEVGIICLYRSQVTCVRQALAERLPPGIASAIQVSTVDAFQGAEKDLIFLSCVRSRPPAALNARPNPVREDMNGNHYGSGVMQCQRPGEYGGTNVSNLPVSKEEWQATGVGKSWREGHQQKPRKEAVEKGAVGRSPPQTEKTYPLLVLSDDEDEEIFATHQKTTGDFMNCPKRMNVALSRARRQLVVVGHEAIFRSHPAWHELWKRSTKLYV